MPNSLASWWPRLTKSLLLGALCLGLVSCSNTQEPLEDLEQLTGFYSGTLDVYNIGDCLINNSDHAELQTAMDIFVDSTGQVEITDYLENHAQWSGEVDDQLDVTLKKIFTNTCPDSTHTDSSYYTGKFDEINDSFTFSIKGVDLWCPAENCRFRYIYVLARVGSDEN